MTRRILLLYLLKAADMTAVMVAPMIAFALMAEFDRDALARLPVLDLGLPIRWVAALAIYAWVWRLSLGAAGLYRSRRLARAGEELRLLIGASAAPALCALAAVLAERPALNPRFATLSVLLTIGLMALERRFVRAAASWLRARGRNLRRILVVADDPRGAESFVHRLGKEDDLGYIVEARHTIDGARLPEEELAEVRSRLDELGIDEVFLVLHASGGNDVHRMLLELCQREGITIRCATNLELLQWTWSSVDRIAGQTVITISGGPAAPLRQAAKRVLDFAAAAVLLIPLAPLFLLIAVLIWIDSPGPALFGQRRVGRNQHVFTMWKFRTMGADAEAQQERLEQENQARGALFKMDDDPRITRIGRLLRRTSIDELPQLWNVLRGEMSLVGPRPLPERDVARIEERWQKRRFSVRPGITCLWQVEGRTADFAELIEADLRYIDRWSFLVDLRILLRTIPAVLSGRGAR